MSASGMPSAAFRPPSGYPGLGDDAAARSAYRGAVATGLDTHYALLAQSRLRSILA